MHFLAHPALLLALSLASPAPSPSPALSESEDAILREAEKLENSLVHLVTRIRSTTVAVVRYGEREIDGVKVEVPAGVGSGVLLQRDGLVFTNVHVIANASRVAVVTSRGDVLPARVHGEVTRFDFAALDVDGMHPAADFGKSALLRPGQFVLAAGNPRGLSLDGEPIVTLGIVSGLGRLAPGEYFYGNAIQTDAEINPGNSGGPLYDLHGDVVGINGKISTTSAALASVGVGYTIPAEQIQRFLPDLARGGKVEPGSSGIRIADQSHPQGGVVIAGVAPGSPADKVGLKPQDRIVELNGEPVTSLTAWINLTAMLPSGRTMSVRYERDGRFASKSFRLEAERSGDGR